MADAVHLHRGQLEMAPAAPVAGETCCAGPAETRTEYVVATAEILGNGIRRRRARDPLDGELSIDLGLCLGERRAQLGRFGAQSGALCLERRAR